MKVKNDVMRMLADGTKRSNIFEIPATKISDDFASTYWSVGLKIDNQNGSREQ